MSQGDGISIQDHKMKGEAMFYIKPNSNCAGLSLTSLETLLGGEWESEPCWSGQPILRTGEDLVPRQIVGWSSLFGGSAINVRAYRRLDRLQIALLGGDWGIRILANEDDGDDWLDPFMGQFQGHLPPGWGVPLLTIEDFSDILDEELREELHD